MATLTAVGVVNGVPNSGTGTASTLDGLIAAGLMVTQTTGTNLHMVVDSAVGLAQGSTTSGQTGSLVMAAAQTAEATAVTNGQTARLVSDITGKLINLPYANPENFERGTVTVATAGAATILATAAAGFKHYVTNVQIANSSSTATTVTFNDTVSTVLYVPALGGNNATFTIPLVTATAALFTGTSSVAVSSVSMNAQGYKGT